MRAVRETTVKQNILVKLPITNYKNYQFWQNNIFFCNEFIYCLYSTEKNSFSIFIRAIFLIRENFGKFLLKLEISASCKNKKFY